MTLVKTPWLACPRPNSQARLRLFCFPYAGAGASVFYPWSSQLPEDIELWAVQPPGREKRLREPLLTSLSSLIETLVPILKPYLDCPFALFGHSIGALVIFALARELRRRNYPVPKHLFVSGRRAPQTPALHPPIHQLPDAAFLAELDRYNGTPEAVLQNRDLMELFLPILRADLAIAETYSYVPEAPLDFPISAFGGLEDESVSPDRLAAWEKQSDRAFSLQMFPGGHFFFKSNPEALLKAISQQLEASGL
ncbi:MAG: thioesterase [Oscillatoria sp. SIO1A7]|nr:thioesterase [Oscillatoria sp. SIO1A7]